MFRLDTMIAKGLRPTKVGVGEIDSWNRSIRSKRIRLSKMQTATIARITPRRY